MALEPRAVPEIKDNEVWRNKEKYKSTACFIENLTEQRMLMITFPPEEISEGHTAAYDNTEIRGRTAGVYSYQNTNSTLSITLNLVDDYLMYGIKQTVDFLKALAYPTYQDDGRIKAPSVRINVGNAEYFVIVTDVSISWQLPLNKNGNYTRADVSLSLELTESPKGYIKSAKDFIGKASENPYDNKKVK